MVLKTFTSYAFTNYIFASDKLQRMRLMKSRDLKVILRHPRSSLGVSSVDCVPRVAIYVFPSIVSTQEQSPISSEIKDDLI